MSYEDAKRLTVPQLIHALDRTADEKEQARRDVAKSRKRNDEHVDRIFRAILKANNWPPAQFMELPLAEVAKLYQAQTRKPVSEDALKSVLWSFVNREMRQHVTSKR